MRLRRSTCSFCICFTWVVVALVLALIGEMKGQTHIARGLSSGVWLAYLFPNRETWDQIHIKSDLADGGVWGYRKNIRIHKEIFEYVRKTHPYYSSLYDVSCSMGNMLQSFAKYRNAPIPPLEWPPGDDSPHSSSVLLQVQYRDNRKLTLAEVAMMLINGSITFQSMIRPLNQSGVPLEPWATLLQYNTRPWFSGSLQHPALVL